MVQTSVAVANKLNVLTAMFFLGDAGYLKALEPQQQQALAYVAVAAGLFPFVLLPAFVAEFSLCLWLRVKGVNVPKWNEAASASG